MSSAEPDNLEWLKSELEQEYEIKSQQIGWGKAADGSDKLKEGQVLNRVVRDTESGWEYEADLRHFELIREQIGLDAANGLTTPGVDAKEDDEEAEAEALAPTEATLFRAVGARCNYLAQDRPDVQFSVKDI